MIKLLIYCMTSLGVRPKVLLIPSLPELTNKTGLRKDPKNSRESWYPKGNLAVIWKEKPRVKLNGVIQRPVSNSVLKWWRKRKEAKFNRHIDFCRIFWLLFVALSWYGSSQLIAAQYDAFQNNPISFVVETTYKDWNTFFPSVVVCESDNTNRIEEISDG